MQWWTSPDPLMDMFANVTPFNFCHNTPINTTDKSGLADGVGWAKVKSFFGFGRIDGSKAAGNQVYRKQVVGLRKVVVKHLRKKAKELLMI